MNLITRINALERFGIKPGLERIKTLLTHLNHPESAYRTILVAGTNGKGSTCAMIESILRVSGYKTGLYTSPHLVYLNERIKVDQKMIDDNSLNGIADTLFKIIEKDPELSDTTYFEFLTGMALLYFSYKKIDVAVLEVGMGGRFDATNAVNPDISIVTNIALDHQQYLGDTVEKIALEKAGIIREHKPFITTDVNPESRHVLEQEANRKNAILYGINHDFFVSGDESNMAFRNNTHSISNLTLSLKGRHQLLNAGAAIQAVLLIDNSGSKVQEHTIRKGLSNTFWPGRFEIIKRHPDVILDSAHNPAGIRALVQTIKDYYLTGSHGSCLKDGFLTTVFAVSRDKDWRAMVSMLIEVSNAFILTCYEGERSAQPESIADFISSTNNGLKHIEVIKSSGLAIKHAIDITPTNGLIVVTGSIFLIGEIKRRHGYDL
ncbi:MAG: bifunctional folylpolyglutamate synthase/dihydrofolate synthase [bacterium]